MEKKMISLGNGYSKSTVISENNSITYRVSFTSGLEFSTPSMMYFYFQNEPVGEQIDSSGINIRVWNPINNTLVETKNFNLTTTNSAANQAFIEYMNAPATNHNIFIITTGGRLFSTPEIDEMLKDKGSTIWPGTWLCSNYPCYYSAVYSPLAGRIITENYTSSDGVLRNEDIRPSLDFVYDSYEDIGATGFIFKPVYDMEEYSTNGASQIAVRYPINQGTRVPLSEYGLKGGDWIHWSFELFAGTDLTVNEQADASIRWFKTGGVSTGTVTIKNMASEVGQWIPHDRYAQIPIDATEFTILVQRNPTEQGSTGKVSVRNMIFTRVSRGPKHFNNPAIGVNGMRIVTATDVDVTDILNLPKEEGIITSADFQEYLD